MPKGRFTYPETPLVPQGGYFSRPAGVKLPAIVGGANIILDPLTLQADALVQIAGAAGITLGALLTGGDGIVGLAPRLQAIITTLMPGYTGHAWSGAPQGLNGGVIANNDPIDVMLEVFNSGANGAAAGAVRPTWTTAGIGTMAPAATFSGGQFLTTPNIARGTNTAICHFAALRPNVPAASVRYISAWGGPTNGPGVGLRITAGGAGGTFEFAARAPNGGNRNSVRTAAVADTNVATLLTGLWDSALATNETSIQVNGVTNVGSRPFNQDITDLSTFTTLAVMFGSWPGQAASSVTGAYNYLLQVSGPSPIPAAGVTALNNELLAAIAANVFW